MIFTAHGVFTPHGVFKSIFKRVPIREQFNFLDGSHLVKLSNTTLGTRSTAYPLATSPTGAVTLNTGPAATLASRSKTINSAVGFPNPRVVMADHPFAED